MEVQPAIADALVPSRRPRRFDALLLARWRGVQLRNMVDQQIRDAPWRTLVVLALLAFIWTSLYMLLATVLRQVNNWDAVGIVATKHIFIHFFLVLAVMLGFSNAILSFGSLYGRSEAGHLLSSPLRPRHVVCVKWLEGMFLSSWSFLLVGVPLMLAVARNTEVEWYYYPLFIGHFLGFVIVPATLGLLVAWLVAMWAPRRPLAVAMWGGILLLGVAGWHMWNLSRNASENEEWVRTLFQQVGVADNPLLPSTWTAEGIRVAIEGKISESLLYLLIVAGNAAFLSWLTINLIGWTWSEAYNRAQLGRSHPTIRSGWFTTGLAWLLFFYLPRKYRAVMLKDLRTFARDATQWTQMVIMLGLLLLYALNLRRLPLELGNDHMKGLIAFLNLTTVSLILATFTSRFVYPLLSLESQQFWLLGLLPMHSLTLLALKFLFALTVTGLSAFGVMWLATYMLELPPAWARLHLASCVAICIGLCGLSVGLGARFPVLGQRNPARIASSFGGTVNLIASMLLVTIVVAGVGMITMGEMRSAGRLGAGLSDANARLAVLLMCFCALTALFALGVGAHKFERRES